MNKILVLLVLGALVALGTADRNGKHQKKRHHDDDDDHDADYEALQKRLDLATARLHHLDDELDERFNPEYRQKALSLEYRVSLLEENNCDKDHYDCGVTDHECVSRLLVCDGHKDCRNGDDEDHCDLPTKKGDHFEGERVYENCSESLPQKFDFTVTAVKVHSDYPAFPIIRATLHFAESTDDDDHEISMPTIGYYRFSNHNLVLKAPKGHSMGLICDFDGHNDDRCVGDIVSIATLNPCARFIFHRKSDDDEEEHHEEEST